MAERSTRKPSRSLHLQVASLIELPKVCVHFRPAKIDLDLVIGRVLDAASRTFNVEPPVSAALSLHLVRLPAIQWAAMELMAMARRL